METTYRFVTNLAVGGGIRLFYLRPGCHAGNSVQQHQLPHIDVTDETWRRLCLEAPTSIYKSTFRILKEDGDKIELEWIT